MRFDPRNRAELPGGEEPCGRWLAEALTHDGCVVASSTEEALAAAAAGDEEDGQRRRSGFPHRWNARRSLALPSLPK